MSLSFYLEKKVNKCVHDSNITHNLNEMAHACGIYHCLWRPLENGFTHASQIIPILEKGLKKLKRDPAEFRKYNASNGWGTYEHFLPWVESVLADCKKHPDAKIRVHR